MKFPSRDVISFYLFSFLIGFYIANGTTVLFARQLGLSFSQVFNLGAVYMLMFILFEVPSGAVADMVGRKKSVILGCLVLVLAAVASGLSQNFLHLFLSFFLWAAGFSFISGADEALLFDKLQNPETYAKVLGKAHFFSLSGMALAGILGPFLFSINFRFPYLFSAIPFFLGALAILSFPEDRKPSGKFSFANHWQQIKTGISVARRNKYVLWAAAILSLVFAVWYNLSNSYQPFLQEIGFSIKAFSVILPILFIMEALGGSLSGKIYNLWGERSAFAASIVGIAVAVGAAGFLHNKAALALLFFYALCLGIIRPMISTYANKHIASENRATVISAQAMMATIASALSLFLFGFLTDWAGVANLFMVLGGLVLVIGLVLLAIKPRDAGY